MFFRWAKGSVYDLELAAQLINCYPAGGVIEKNSLDQVEYGDAVTDGRKKTCSVGCEEQVSSAVDGAQQVGELGVVLVMWDEYI
jgi:hypothetical protein